MTAFQILIKDAFANVTEDADLTPLDNKRVLSLVNDFQDGAWWLEKFEKYVWNNIAQTALSAKERETIAAQPYEALVAAAKKLRLTDQDKDDKGRGSEIAEIVLYGIMKDYYNALPVVPKIFYKQNSKDYAKGSDSVHIVLTEDDFEFWFGEAKFYSDISNSRLDAILDSVEESLTTEKLEKENSIITNLNDFDNLGISDDLKPEIVRLLASGTSMDELKPKLNVPILLLHECVITGKCTEMSDDYRNEILAYHRERATKYFSKQIERLASRVSKYSDIRFHILLFPVANKAQIVDRFTQTATMFRGR